MTGPLSVPDKYRFMKITSRFHSVLAASAALLLLAARATAALITDFAAYSPNLLIPDSSLVGVADTRNFSSLIDTITEVRVGLNIAGTPGAGDAFNGDFYAYLTHSSGFAVLLNRAGRSAANPFGYGDSGFNVTFDDTPAGNDIHNYQLVSNPGGGALGGIWNSDGRNVTPAAALNTTARTAFLTSFNSLNPNGDWTLFVADSSFGGTGRLAGWSLEVTGDTAIPEPSTGLFGVLLTAILLRERRRRR